MNRRPEQRKVEELKVPPPTRTAEPKSRNLPVPLLFIAVPLFIILYFSIQYTMPSKIEKDTAPPTGKERLFTPEELKNYDGTQSDTVYLAVLGRVFDVSKGRDYYGPEGGYKIFAGRDGTRAFVTGTFTEEGATDDITGLSGKEILSVEYWVNFYNNQYAFVGKLVGRYYDSNGKPTAALVAYETALKKAKQEEKRKAEEGKKFPGCNSEWFGGKGGRVWCSEQSGGVTRPWKGVPRQLFDPKSGSTSCVCVEPALLDHPHLKLYPNCEEDSESCALPDKK